MSDVLVCVGGPLAGRLFQLAEDQDWVEGLAPESLPKFGEATIDPAQGSTSTAKRVAYRRRLLCVYGDGRRVEALFDPYCADPLETLLRDYYDQILEKEVLKELML